MDKILKTALEVQQKFVKEARGVTSFCFVMEDGKYDRVYGAGCFAGYMKSHRSPGCVAFLTKHNPYNTFVSNEKYKKQKVAYIDWLLNRSVWAPMFLHKDVDNCINKSSIMDTNNPYHMVIQAAIFYRYIKEHPSIVKAWHYFSQFLTEDAAIWAAHRWSFNYDKKTLSENGPNDTQGHTSFNCRAFTKDEFRKFLAHDTSIAQKQKLFSSGQCSREGGSVTAINWFVNPKENRYMMKDDRFKTDLVSVITDLGKDIIDVGFTDTLGRKHTPKNGSIIPEDKIEQFLRNFQEVNEVEIFK